MDETGGLKLAAESTDKKPTLKATFLEGWPFAAAGILGTMVFRIDVVMLREMLPQGGDEMAGLYGAGYRLMESGHFLAASVAAAMFPALVRRRSEGGTLPFRYPQESIDWFVFGGVLRWDLPVYFGGSFVESVGGR